MKKKLLMLAVCVLAISALLAVAAFAADSSGYMFDSDGKTYTNIKWTFTEADKTVVFEIDASATDKKASTVLYGFDPITGTRAVFSTPIQNGWGQLAELKKAVIKEGITEINGGLFDLNRTVEQIEIPTSLKTISGGAFAQGTHKLSSIYITGGTPEAGVFDLSCVESFEGASYVFDNAQSLASVKFNSALTGSLGTEFIKSATKLTELTIPEGVTQIKSKALSGLNYLKVLTILGTETTLAGDDVFNMNTTFPAIKAKADSKAAEFAKTNGYTFIDLDTGETTKGTKTTTGASTGTSTGTSTGGSTGGSTGDSTGGTTTPAEGVGLDAFDPNECTDYGYIGGQFYDTYWVYYQETRTLKFISNKTSGWNETGRIDKCVDKSWAEYQNEIEYIEVGPYLAKVTSSAFTNHTALKEIKLGKNIGQIDHSAFNGCTSLTTIWKEGYERVEGRADLSTTTLTDAYKNTAITEFVLNKSVTEIPFAFSPSCKTIYVNEMTDYFIEYAKTNLFNVQSLTNPDEKYEYWVYVDPTLPSCGPRSVFGFDEATGVLTVYGAGAIDDIVNYYGGGSKNQPWFSIRDNVKHVIIGDAITSIGKYAFCELSNLETVQIPNVESFEILNAAFEKCTNLKSIYRAGTDPIEGTVDIRNVHTINAWTFAYDYLIANVILSPQVDKIGSSVFEENVNLAGIYGTVGSFAEKYAADGGLTFYDVATNTPQPVKCELPETTEAPTSATEPSETTETVDTAESTEAVTTSPLFSFDDETNSEDKTGDTSSDSETGVNPVVIVIIIIAGILVVAVVVVSVILKKKKK